ncbi:hypothetical protein COCON_G00109650 [Conger conger]|uniref:Protein VAC14 homolog n=1 Tax=Conger conger TaxID=82655 RepID=A0A9Q1DJK7_CONCO|nr:hypothetical protein COCON_G00109650 [Conger conger]
MRTLLVREFVAQNNSTQIRHIIQILASEFALSQHPTAARGGSSPWLPAPSPWGSRLRYYACEALYNIVKDIVTESNKFDLVAFVPLLRERIYSNNQYVRQFIISWILVLESVPDINLLDYLPEILDGLFQILGDSSKEIRRTGRSLILTSCFLTELEAEEWFKTLSIECLGTRLNDISLGEPDLLAAGVQCEHTAGCDSVSGPSTGLGSHEEVEKSVLVGLATLKGP